MHSLTIVKLMKPAARVSNPYQSNPEPLREDDALAALAHLYLELQLPPQSAWRAARADCHVSRQHVPGGGCYFSPEEIR